MRFRLPKNFNDKTSTIDNNYLYFTTTIDHWPNELQQPPKDHRLIPIRGEQNILTSNFYENTCCTIISYIKYILRNNCLICFPRNINNKVIEKDYYTNNKYDIANAISECSYSAEGKSKYSENENYEYSKNNIVSKIKNHNSKSELMKRNDSFREFSYFQSEINLSINYYDKEYQNENNNLILSDSEMYDLINGNNDLNKNIIISEIII